METENKKPWWVSDQEKAGLTTVPATPDTKDGIKEFGKSLGNDVNESVPRLKMVNLARVIAEYGVMDGLLNYHFYEPTRYAIRIEAEEQMEKVRQDQKFTPKMKEEQQNALARSANNTLEQVPWPNAIEEIISAAFHEVFPYNEFKVSYFPEVDSWSLVTPIPVKGITDDARLQAPIQLVNERLIEVSLG